MIEVKTKGGSKYFIYRRYREFFALHQNLESKYSPEDTEKSGPNTCLLPLLPGQTVSGFTLHECMSVRGVHHDFYYNQIFWTCGNETQKSVSHCQVFHHGNRYITTSTMGFIAPPRRERHLCSVPCLFRGELWHLWWHSSICVVVILVYFSELSIFISYWQLHSSQMIFG